MSRRSRSGLERRVERLWYGESALAPLLLPFAWLFGLVVAIRRAAYRSGLLRRERVGVPVVVVGNITAGGAGKTPLVAWLVGRLAREGRRVGVVSRGYGGTEGRRPIMVAGDSDPGSVGDEPVLLARQTSAPVCVCRDRVAAARRLIDDANVDLIVCDDGLQHYRLDRDIEIAVVDGVRGLGNGHLLPAGPLREPAGRLDQVDFLFLNGGNASVGRRPSDMRFELRPRPARRLRDGAERGLEAFAGRRVWAVAGIGNPGRFARMLRAADIEPELVDVPDHGTVSLRALRDAEPWPILMTAKDAVKYPPDDVDDAWCVPVDLELPASDESALLKRLRALYG